MWIPILLVCCCFSAIINAANLKDTKKVVPTQQRALIAIQIVKGESGKTKNSKRTIESSLGYGQYQDNNFVYKSQDGKFEIYPYSQKDIPPYYSSTKDVEIQPADSYVVGKTPGKQQYEETQYQQSYYPKPTEYPKTLFSSINQGQIGHVSAQIPTQFVNYPVTDNHQQQLQIPVIILRVYSDQLNHAQDLYPNLPASNPYAAYLNMINLQSILSQYNPQPQYQQPQYEQQNYPISENYPDEAHTQVVIPPKKSVSSKYYKSSTKSTINHDSYSYSKAPSYSSHQQSYESYNPEAYIPQGNEYSVPVPEAQNYYQQPQTSTETQYLYLHEKDLGSNGGGYVYQDQATGQLMYYPHQMQNTKYEYSEQQYQSDPKALLYTREPQQYEGYSTTVTEPTTHHTTESDLKVYNYHAHSTRSAPKRNTKTKSKPMVLAPERY